MHQDPGQRHPGHRLHPAAGRRGRHREARRRPPRSTTSLDMNALEDEHDPRHARGRHGRRQALRPAGQHERQEPGAVHEEGLGDGGLQPPTDIDGSNALTEQIKADGNTPWCMGIESGTATGWPATDWFEDLVMRYGGRTSTTTWVSHETKFDSDVVKEAAAEFEELMFTEGNVLGGRKAIAEHQLRHGRQPDVRRRARMLDVQAGLVHHRLLPQDDREADIDDQVGVFGFPPVEAGGDNPVLGGGDLATMLNDQVAPRRVMKLLRRPTSATRRPSPARSSRRTRTSTSRTTRTTSPATRPRSPTSRRSSSSTGRTRCPARSVRVRSGRR